MRIATYNIHRCVGADGRSHPRRILRVLEALDADVVALQEVESCGSAEDPLGLFAAEGGYHVVRGPTLLRESGEYGNALLCRQPALSLERLDLTIPGHEPRGAIDVRLADDAIRVVATHLGLRPAERRKQVKRLLGHLGDLDATPLVLMGDLNEWFLWGRPLRYLHRAFARTPAYATYPARWPLLPLDRIWVHPPDRLCEVSVLRTAEARAASDHLPVVAVIESGGRFSASRPRKRWASRGPRHDSRSRIAPTS